MGQMTSLKIFGDTGLSLADAGLAQLNRVGLPPDEPGWPYLLPLATARQLAQLYEFQLDAADAALRALLLRPSWASLSLIRSQAENFAWMRYLTNGPRDRMPARSAAFLLRSVQRLRKMQPEGTSQEESNEVEREVRQRLAAQNLEVPETLGWRSLWRNHLPELGECAYRLLSEAGTHTGLHQMNAYAAPYEKGTFSVALNRAYWASVALGLLAEATAKVARELGWSGWMDAGPKLLVEPVLPLLEETRDAWNAQWDD